MNFDKYLVSIEDQLSSETREIGPPPAASNKSLRTPASRPASGSRALPSPTPNNDLPPPKKTLVQRPRPTPTLYKNFRLDPLSQPFMTPLKRPHSQTSDQNGKDNQDLTEAYEDGQDPTADFDDHEESGLEKENSPPNDYEQDEEGESVSHIVFSQNPSSSQTQFAPKFTAESASRDENETYPTSGPWTADAYALFG